MDGLRKIIHLLNGNLILPYRKRQLSFAQFVRIRAIFISSYNKRMLWHAQRNASRFDTTQIIPLSTNILPNLQNAWLAGFTDAEGCFFIGIYTKHFQIRYDVSQTKEENLPILKHLVTLFGIGKNPHQNRFQITGVKNFILILRVFL